MYVLIYVYYVSYYYGIYSPFYFYLIQQKPYSEFNGRVTTANSASNSLAETGFSGRISKYVIFQLAE